MSETLDIDENLARLREVDAKFCAGLEQLELLNQAISDKKVRCQRACQRGQRSWYYSLRLQLASMEGVRLALMCCVSKVWQELRQIQDNLVVADLMSQSLSSLPSDGEMDTE